MFKFLSTRITAVRVGIVLVLVALAGLISVYSVQRQAIEGIQHAVETERRLYQLMSHLEDAETGQRGYLLTDEERYLEPYFTGLAAIDSEVQAIAELTADNPHQQQLLATLKLQSVERLSLLKGAIDLRRSGERDRAQETIQLGLGKVSMDRVRATLSRMLAEEQRLLDGRRRDIEQLNNMVVVGRILAFALVIAFALLVIAEGRRQTRGLVAARDSLAVANAALVQEALQRGDLEHLLRQSQKMEAVGQLTGGIAHDFNNILMVITGNVEALAEAGNMDGEASKRLDRIASSTRRAADLTRQLLAFARKQPLQPQSTNLNDIVVAINKLLTRTLGEHIEIEVVLADELWSTNVDRTQLEAALINLCVNARDAMPTSGRLLIETENRTLDEEYERLNPEAVAGDYAMLAVSDTGQGIPAGVLDRVFEPFFTTKEVGKGTGLGLSMVYGFIKQSGGHIKIYSEVGHGTTLRIYLPRSDRVSKERDRTTASVPRGVERILVVEDDSLVRENLVVQLESLGYDVGQADCPGAALERLSQDTTYDVLLTDVVMPGPMKGEAFAGEAKRRHADLRLLFMSGYTENAIVRNGLLRAGVRLLSKPFRKIDLARAIRDALDDNADAGPVRGPQSGQCLAD